MAGPLPLPFPQPAAMFAKSISLWLATTADEAISASESFAPCCANASVVHNIVIIAKAIEIPVKALIFFISLAFYIGVSGNGKGYSRHKVFKNVI